MKNITQFIKESCDDTIESRYGDDITLQDVAREYINHAAYAYKGKLKTTDADEILGLLDERELASALGAMDEDEVYDFIQCNYDELIELIDQMKKDYKG